MPLEYAELVKTLGYQRTMQWFPVLPPDAQHPYDTGPYQKPKELTPLPSQLDLSQVRSRVLPTRSHFSRSLPKHGAHGGESTTGRSTAPNRLQARR